MPACGATPGICSLKGSKCPSRGCFSARRGARMNLDSKRIHTGRGLNLDVDTGRFPAASRGEPEIARPRGAAAVVPFASDPRGDGPTVLLIQQYRYATDG